MIHNLGVYQYIAAFVSQYSNILYDTQGFFQILAEGEQNEI